MYCTNEVTISVLISLSPSLSLCVWVGVDVCVLVCVCACACVRACMRVCMQYAHVTSENKPYQPLEIIVVYLRTHIFICPVYTQNYCPNLVLSGWLLQHCLL